MITFFAMPLVLSTCVDANACNKCVQDSNAYFHESFVEALRDLLKFGNENDLFKTCQTDRVVNTCSVNVLSRA